MSGCKVRIFVGLRSIEHTAAEIRLAVMLLGFDKFDIHLSQNAANGILLASSVFRAPAVLNCLSMVPIIRNRVSMFRNQG